MVAPTDTDAHNLLLVHLHPSDMNWKEKHAYVHPAKKMQRKERRTDIQKSNKRKGHWTNHGTTGIAVARGHKTSILALVTPHLRQHVYGDRRTDECILLKGEDNTR